MKDSTKLIIEVCLIVIVISLTLVFLGGIVGSRYFPTTNEVLISERIASCEEKGGVYGLFWSEYSSNIDGYYEYCDVKEDTIYDF